MDDDPSRSLHALVVKVSPVPRPALSCEVGAGQVLEGLGLQVGEVGPEGGVLVEEDEVPLEEGVDFVVIIVVVLFHFSPFFS